MEVPQIDAEQRDMLYEAITDSLSGDSDVFIECKLGNFDRAQRLSSEYSDYLRVLHDDLGWGDSSHESVRLTAPQDVWERTLTRIQSKARSDSRRHEERISELEEERQHLQALDSICTEVAEQMSRAP